MLVHRLNKASETLCPVAATWIPDKIQKLDKISGLQKQIGGIREENFPF